MSAIDQRRVEAVTTRIQTGLGAHAQTDSRQRSVDIADRLVAVKDTIDLEIDLEGVEGDLLTHAKSQLDPESLHGLRKIAEIIEDDFDIDVGHSKFARLAATASTVSSYVALGIAGYNLLLSAENLHRAAAKANSLAAVKEKRFNEFYRAVCVFTVECFFLATPFSFKFAWKGTRYFNNRILYRLRNVSPRLHKYILSEIHYAIKGIGKEMLRSVEQFSSYLVAMTVQTLKLIQAHSGLEIGKLHSEAESIIEEFQTFVKEAYEVSVPEVDIGSIISDVVTEFRSEIDILG